MRQPRHAPEYFLLMERLAPLLRQVPKFRAMDFGFLCDWVAYYWNRGTISYVIDYESDNSARGVCMVKLFRHLGQFLEPFVHDPCGKYCMVEALVAKDPVAIAATYFELVGRWGKPEVVLWDRFGRTENGSPRMYHWDQYEKLTRRLTFGLIDKERKRGY